MIRRPPRSTRTDTLFPYTTLFRSEKSVAARRLQIILPLGDRPADQFDLPRVESETDIGGLALRLDGAVVGKQYPLRTAFDDRGCDAAIRNVSETLRCEHHGYILLAQHLQPFAAECGEQRKEEHT